MIEFNGLTFLVAGLAVYRVAKMVAEEEGPFSVFAKMRSATAHFKMPDEKNWIARGVRCPMCISFWLGWLAAIPLYQSVAQYVLVALALSAVAVIIHKFLG